MKMSAAHQQAVDEKNAAKMERLAYHRILTAMMSGDRKWGSLQRVGSVCDKGDSYVWQVAFTPRMRDAVIMETFTSHSGQGETVRCFFLEDARSTYYARSFDSTDERAKLQQLYFRAVEMERVEQNRVAA